MGSGGSQRFAPRGRSLWSRPGGRSPALPCARPARRPRRCLSRRRGAARAGRRALRRGPRAEVPAGVGSPRVGAPDAAPEGPRRGTACCGRDAGAPRHEAEVRSAPNPAGTRAAGRLPLAAAAPERTAGPGPGPGRRAGGWARLPGTPSEAGHEGTPPAASVSASGSAADEPRWGGRVPWSLTPAPAVIVQSVLSPLPPLTPVSLCALVPSSRSPCAPSPRLPHVPHPLVSPCPSTPPRNFPPDSFRESLL